MKYYVDITLLPDVDIALYFLWNKVYQQVHLALVEQQDGNGRVNIGAAFPGYRYEEKCKTLGGKLRLFSLEERDLCALNLPHWFSRLNDYVHVTSIRPVPDKFDSFALFKRVQPKSNLERIARRKAKRSGSSVAEALESFGDKKEIVSQAPFIRLSSLSSDHQFRLMIVRQVLDEPGDVHGFSTYGLSSEEIISPVPLF